MRGVCDQIWPGGGLEWAATYEVEEGDWAEKDLALTRDGGVIIAVDNTQFGFLKLPSFQVLNSSICDEAQTEGFPWILSPLLPRSE